MSLTQTAADVVCDTAYAKINLALHIRARRADGYHELETLFAFLDVGDSITARASDAFVLDEVGEFAAAMGPVEDNLVTRAALAANGGTLPDVHFRVDKRLPVAAGLGGGSADAGAVLRLLGKRGAEGERLAAGLGADVPACVASVPVIGRGTGTELTPIEENDVAGLACLLVNPRLPVPTGPVFRAWDQIDRGAMPGGSARAIMLAGRNDLEAPAVAICPAVADVLAALRVDAPLLARMSGSGATCFALYESSDVRDAAAARIGADHPGWWQMAGKLR